MDKWTQRFLALAQHIAQWSKDPSTKTGAVIVRPDRTIASLGYNGFPRGIEDTPERLNDREQKYPRVVHAEMNAILNAHEPVVGCTLYIWPWMPCGRCAVHVIQAGIVEVVSVVPSQDRRARWAKEFLLAHELFAEAGIPVLECNGA